MKSMPKGLMRLDKLLARVGLADSVSDAVRKLKQKAVKVNGEVKDRLGGSVGPESANLVAGGKEDKKNSRSQLHF